MVMPKICREHSRGSWVRADPHLSRLSGLKWMKLLPTASFRDRGACARRPYGLTRSKLGRLMDDFQHSGGDAAEVSYGSINPVQQSTLTTMVQERAVCLAGSDFHSADRQWTDIGKFPGLGSAAKKCHLGSPKMAFQLLRSRSGRLRLSHRNCPCEKLPHP